MDVKCHFFRLCILIHLIVNHVEHLSMCSLIVNLLAEMFMQNLCPFLNQVNLKIMYYGQHIPQIHGLQVLSPILWVIFIFHDSIFWSTHISHFDEIKFTWLLLAASAFGDISKTTLFSIKLFRHLVKIDCKSEKLFLNS